jgi:7-alpha-hydroxysteroid dehydrogenase
MSQQSFRLDHQVALVTGAGKGIGASIATHFAEAGADVVLSARTESDLERVAEAVRAHGRRAFVVPGDVNNLDFLARLIDQTVVEMGALDIVVNNAGGTLARPFMQTTASQLEKSFHFNVVAPFELSRLAVPHLLKSEAGNIVNIGSMAGVFAVRGSLAHSLTKSALAQLTRLSAADLSPRIRVNAVLPGAIETDALAGYLDMLPPTVKDEMIRRTAMRRNGVADDIASAALFLASPAASWMTGKLLEVDGKSEENLIPMDLPDL